MRDYQRRLTVDDPTVPPWKDLAIYVAGVCAALIAWIWRWAWVKLDGKIDRAEVERRFDRMFEAMERRDDEAQESRAVIHQKLDLTIADATRTAVSVARLEGELSKRVRRP